MELEFILGVVQKGRQRGREGGEYPKMVTNDDIGGGGYVQMVTSPHYFFNINIFHISYYFLFSSHPLKLELNT